MNLKSVTILRQEVLESIKNASEAVWECAENTIEKGTIFVLEYCIFLIHESCAESSRKIFFLLEIHDPCPRSTWKIFSENPRLFLLKKIYNHIFWPGILESYFEWPRIPWKIIFKIYEVREKHLQKSPFILKKMKNYF